MLGVDLDGSRRIGWQGEHEVTPLFIGRSLGRA
jgi:hypothetical protein